MARRRGGFDIVRPRHPGHSSRAHYRGTPAYAPAGKWVLTVFNGRAPGSFFALFTDETSGVTTYAANRSRPPAGNRLPVAVEAGEKIPYERLSASAE